MGPVGDRGHPVPRGSCERLHRRAVDFRGARCFMPVYSDGMATLEKAVRQSVSLPRRVARRVKALARTKKTSANRIVVDLIEAGLEAREREKSLFFDLADRLTRSTDAAEQKRLKENLARMTFGD